MFSLLHYISASRRLKESEKTIFMLGGKQECNEMILAQNEMIKLERDYYRDESIKFGLFLVVISVVALFVFTFYMKVINV